MDSTPPVPADPEAAWRTVLEHDPFDPTALHGLGRILLRHRRPAQAVALLSDAVAFGGQPDALSDLGTALIEIGQPEQAEPYLRRAVREMPDHYNALFNLGGLLLERGETDEALPLLRHAVSAAPPGTDAEQALASALIARGNTAYASGDLAAAERSYREAIATGEGLTAAYTNLGNALTGQLRLPEALEAYRSALALDPNSDGTGFAYALCLLLSGNPAGWAWYEHRRNVPQLRPDHERRPGLPRWRTGTAIAGKRILVTAEQGAGDLIQYARFVPALARQAAAVDLEMPWPLAGLFQDLPGVRRVVTLTDTDPPCDMAIPLLSLPLLLGPDAGVAPPYIPRPEDRRPRWDAWLNRSPPGRRIGLVCHGDPRHPHDRDRSIPLAAFAPLLSLPGVAFILIQTEIRDTDRPAFDAYPDLRCPAAALTDYADTAALLSGLDRLITVDTSVAHLAGAMGLPVWTLLQYCPDYRWMLGRADSPWYPAMRLFRQDRPGDWQPVIERVRHELASER